MVFKIAFRKVFVTGFIAVFTIILLGILHSFTIASPAITNPESAINQRAYSQEIIAQSPVPNSDQTTPINSPEPSEISTSDTALLFQNDRYAVRVFRQGKQAYINVYDKENQNLSLEKVPVSITPARNPNQDPTKYIASIGDKQYIVIIKPIGASELTILQKGTVTYRQDSNQVEIARKIIGISAQPEAVNPTRELVKTVFINYAKLTLFTIMLSMGLRWTFADVAWLWKQPSLLLRSLFSVFVAVPLFAILALFIPGLTVAERIGIGAMIACPGAPMIPFKSLKAGGNVKFVASLQFAVCVLVIFSIPLIAVILAQFYPNQAWLSPEEIGKQIFFAQVLPMGLGVLLAQYSPKVADDLLEPINNIGKFLLLLLAIVLLVVSLDKVINAGLSAYLAITFITIASLACGHFLGGTHVENQNVLAYATVTRNAGLALLLVTLNFPNLDYVKGGIINTLITYALIAAIVSIPYTRITKQHGSSKSSDQGGKATP